MLKRSEKLAYGSGQVGIHAVDFFLRLYLLIFFTDVVGLPGTWAGVAVGLAVIWDAFTDPVMGNLSDYFHAKRGLRRFWFLWGASLTCVFVALLFLVSPEWPLWLQFSSLLGFYIALNTALTVYDIPYAALGGDMTKDRHERTEVFGWRLGFGNLGAILGVAIPGLTLTQFSDGPYFWAALGICLSLILTVLTCYFFTQDHGSRKKQDAREIVWNPFQNFQQVLKNPHFRILLLAYLFATFGLSINSTIALYYYRYRLELAEWQTQSIINVFMIVFTIAIVVWILISRKFGKKKPLVIGISLLGLSGSIVYPLAPVGSMVVPMVYSVFAGLLIGSVVLLDSFLVDIVEYDQMKTRENRMGLYFGVWRMTSKLTRAGAIAVAGVFIDWIQLSPDEAPSPEGSWSLALMFGPGVNLFFVVGALIAFSMSYDDEAHVEVQKVLAERGEL